MSLLADHRFHTETCKITLPRVAEDLRWAHAAGFWPSQRWLDDVGGADLSQDEDKRLKGGPQFDIGIGDYASRRAVEAAGPELARVEVHLAAGLVLEGRKRQPPLVKPDGSSSLTRMLVCIQAARWRANELWRIHDPGRDTVEQARKAARVINDLRSSLIKVTFKGSVDAAGPNLKLCRICGLRAQEPKCGKRCRICSNYFHRNKNQERPRHLDDDIRVIAREKQQARIDRGDGWGAA